MRVSWYRNSPACTSPEANPQYSSFTWSRSFDTGTFSRLAADLEAIVLLFKIAVPNDKSRRLFRVAYRFKCEKWEAYAPPTFKQANLRRGLSGYMTEHWFSVTSILKILWNKNWNNKISYKFLKFWVVTNFFKTVEWYIRWIQSVVFGIQIRISFRNRSDVTPWRTFSPP